MDHRPPPTSQSRQTRPSRQTRTDSLLGRFKRTDGRYDLPVILGRSPKQVARRLA
jgi:hypothetical protein